VAETTPDREFDIMLLGATGFTGALTAERLVERLSGTDHRLAIAGRDPVKLEDRKQRLVASDTWAESVGIVVADNTDLVSLLDAAARTRVLLTTVGPYEDLGELVVQACIRQGTDYADITGEPRFVNRILARYDGDARRAGVRVVNCCGFDSIPHDLGVQFTVEHLPDDVPVRVRGIFSAGGQLSGGTARTAVRHFSRMGEPSPRPPRREQTDRRVGSLPLRPHRVPEVEGWAVPAPTIDPQIVLRSARALPEYGPDFRYGHFLRLSSLPKVAGLGAGLVGAVAAAQLGPTRRLLERMLPDPGSGPDEETRARGWFRVTFLAEAKETELRTEVRGGDPGYEETSRMFAETGLALAFDELPEVSGVVTPAQGLGERLRERIIDTGITFEVVSG
jgi:short subunit dehydrogenase-like uncharacterized protein